MKNLRSIRLEKKISQQEIADYIGVNRVTYTNYENNKRDPDTDTLSKIADFFGVTTDYLLGRETSIKTDKSVSITLDELELLQQIKLASADKQKAIELILGIKEQAALVSSDK